MRTHGIQTPAKDDLASIEQWPVGSVSYGVERLKECQ